MTAADRKLELECEKLAAERRLLARQLTTSWHFLEWLKGLTVPAAIFSVIATVGIGYQQIQQAQEARLNDRFEKVLVRLASQNANERLTGVAGLSLFTSDRGSAGFDKLALFYLVEALATEADSTVQDAIIDVFRKKELPVGRAVLDHAIAKNRLIFGAIERTHEQRRIEAQTRALESLHKKPRPRPPEAPESAGPQETMSIATAQNVVTMLAYPLEGQPREQKILEGLASLIVTVLRRNPEGVEAVDLSGIYCVDCDFSGLSLRGANFTGSVLSSAKFVRSDLRQSVFLRSDASGAMFYRADLRGSTFGFRKGPQRTSIGNRYPFPFLECANLGQVNLADASLYAEL